MSDIQGIRPVWVVVFLLLSCQAPHWKPADYQQVHEAAIGVYPPDKVPYGAVFLLYGEPTGKAPSSSGEAAWVEFEIEGFRARAEVEPGDHRVDVANELARAFRHKGLRVVVSPQGDWLICESPHGDDISSMGGGSHDAGLATGFCSLRD